MDSMKNSVVFLQYMPNNWPTQFGIKKFNRCDPVTRYVMHVEL